MCSPLELQDMRDEVSERKLSLNGMPTRRFPAKYQAHHWVEPSINPNTYFLSTTSVYANYKSIATCNMSRDTEEKEPRKPSSEPHNPFIKFRQFADEQISTLLQGIIGLPSALSKVPGNATWAYFDDDFRRRDDLQVEAE